MEKDYIKIAKLTKEELLKLTNSTETGLTTHEANQRLDKHGLNITIKREKKSWLNFLLESFQDKFILILVILAMINFFLGDALGSYIIIGIALVFGVIMVSLYAPADTENIPIISKKERKRKKILSYTTLVLTLIVSIFIKDSIISNILIFGVIVQSFMISRLAYLLTNNKYGYKVYQQKEKLA